MIYTKKEKDDMRRSLGSLLHTSDKIKAITKTKYITELEKERFREHTAYEKNLLNYVFYKLEGNSINNLKEWLVINSKEAMCFLEKSEKKLFSNVIKKVKNKNILVADTTKPLYIYLSQLVKEENKTNISFLNNDLNFEHVDLALIPIAKIDLKGNMSIDENYLLLLVDAKQNDVPVYGYIHSLNFVQNLEKTDKNIIKPNLIKKLISDIGIFEPGFFVEELKVKRPWLFF